MAVETGRLTLAPGPGGFGLRVRYRRPELGRLLLGRTLDEALLWSGRLHALCGMAHRIAMVRAAEAGAGRPATPRRCQMRELALVLERVEAMARHVGLDWPRATDQAVRPDLVRPVLAAVAAARQALGPCDGRAALDPDRATLTNALVEAGRAYDRLVATHSAAPVPVVAGPGVADLVEAAWFAPQALGDELAAASAVELDAEPALPLIENARGSGSAETVRGRLVTELALEGGRVAGVSWTTPTDRLFGTHGPATLLLQGWDGTQAELRIVMAAFDPCVPWDRAAAAAHA